ncbi:3-hydroxyacyl-CoA dehydrogenase family protein [Nonomuraea typhae]|uniref:3-hydroxyacyl-CoA dehydrogenase family protein n=1 Tax=Nonomuraea typhae TaxID=2603600 RepID=UPI0012F7EF12|nr:3-hydroxybutyryl-CoA dehydrogenase [Nonomuraea typhae]
MAFEKVGVVGLGTMGAGIAEVFARAGIRVIGVEADAEALARGRGHLERSTGRALDKGRLTAEEREAILGRVTLTTAREDLADADLVIEAIPEVLEYKVALFADLDRICKPETVLATNTSSLPVTAIAAATGRPKRVIGMHFFNPAPVMKLVEVVGTILTEDGLLEEVSHLAWQLGKTAVVVGDLAGFVVNRLLLPYLNHAAVLLEHGVARRDDIDAAMRKGVGLPMGPFALLDLIGLDTAYEIMGVLFGETRSTRHAPAPLLRELVGAGLLGRKTGRGFYDQDGPAPAEAWKAHVTGVTVHGEGAEEFAARLDAAGFRASDTPDLVLRLGERPVIEHAVRHADPSRVVGIHLVGQGVAEVVSTVLTSPEAAGAAAGLMTVLGLTAVPCKDRAGFVADALLFAHLNDAVRMHASGYASIDDIDTAMRLGCGYPAGPFEMLERIGLRKVRDGLRALYAEYREPSFAPAALLDQLVAAGLPAFPRA